MNIKTYKVATKKNIVIFTINSYTKIKNKLR